LRRISGEQDSSKKIEIISSSIFSSLSDNEGALINTLKWIGMPVRSVILNGSPGTAKALGSLKKNGLVLHNKAEDTYELADRFGDSSDQFSPKGESRGEKVESIYKEQILNCKRMFTAADKSSTAGSFVAGAAVLKGHTALLDEWKDIAPYAGRALWERGKYFFELARKNPEARQINAEKAIKVFDTCIQQSYNVQHSYLFMAKSMELISPKSDEKYEELKGLFEKASTKSNRDVLNEYARFCVRWGRQIDAEKLF